MKQQHLSEALGLTDDQQAKIKPTPRTGVGRGGNDSVGSSAFAKGQAQTLRKTRRSVRCKDQTHPIYNSGGQASGASQTTKGGAQKAYRRAKRRQAKLICS